MEAGANTSAATNVAQGAPPRELLQMADAFIVNRCLGAVAKLGVADSLALGAKSVAELAAELKVNESALCRVLRAAASAGVFEETGSRVFGNNRLSHFLRTDVPGSMRARFVFGWSEFTYAPFGEIVYSIETGQPARAKLYGEGPFEYLREHPEQARIFDDAMTAMSAAIGPAVAAAYDFGRWGSVMDVGGGNGILLASILKAHPKLRGVLADVPHVLERARERGFLSGELEARASMQSCDFFREIPSGCRAYVMKSVIHDWDDEKARKILSNCRRAVPKDGALLLVEFGLAEGNDPSPGKIVDVAMLVLTGGKERTTDEYRDLLAGAGFRLNRAVPMPTGMNVIEALPT
ncbi:MAG TPA: methyltransferase [Candidatus Acidoferrales bacterium]|nr:methyltransferase [Candidatus Acidoferrales bacterium]